jgi:hypothetical protein
MVYSKDALKTSRPSMKTLLILAMLLSTSQSSDQPYELKGEAPGMTVKQFKANHKHAECSNRTAHQMSCHVYDGVSFAGVTAATYKGCALLECSAQGISANFVDGRLVYLAYGVSPGSATEIIRVLKAKFGEPTETDGKSAAWRNSVGYLLVSEVVVPSGNGPPKDIATNVISALKDSGQGKDI